METIDKTEQIDWIFSEMRKSLEKIRNAQEEDSEWDTGAEEGESWE